MAPTALDLSLDVIEISVLIASVFYGNVIVQCYIFSQNSTKDKLGIKLLVAFVLLLETIHTVFIWMYLYRVSVTNYGNPVALTKLPWDADMSLMIQGLVGSSVQAFFSYRTWAVSGTIFFAIPGWIGELVRAGLSIALTIVTMRTGELTEFRNKYDWIGVFTCVLSAIIDIWNTAVLCWYLRVLQSNTPFRTTVQTINKLILWSIETGLFTSIVAVLLVAFLVGQKSTSVWIGIVVIYAKVYSNSLLVSLNARQKIRALNEAPPTSGSMFVTNGSALAPSHVCTLDLGLNVQEKNKVKNPRSPIMMMDIERHGTGADCDQMRRVLGQP